MKDEMCATLGGRAAERVIFNKISTGALSDLEKVTKQARAMVTIYGLNDIIGNLTYYDSSGQSEYGFTKPYSEETAQKIDEEISKLIEEQYARAIDVLEKNKDKLTELAERLLEKEVIFKEDLEKIFGKRPFEKKFDKKGQEITADKEKPVKEENQLSEDKPVKGKKKDKTKKEEKPEELTEDNK
jgi:cell division protease FtsH